MFCKKNGGLIAVIVGVFIAISVAQRTHAETFEGIDIKVEGKGAAMLFIPGLNSSSDVFTDTCAAFKSQYRCYRLQLPGFAGQPAISIGDQGFLITMRNTIEHYIRTQKLGRVVLVGHSLGGLLSLMIAIDQPDMVSRIVILDSLPFLSAVQNPNLTAETAKPMAAQMRDAMNNQSLELYTQQATTNIQGMSNNPTRIPTIASWGKSSDRTTTTMAMYELMTTDLRESIATIKTPTLVLGTWAAYKNFGATKESTQTIFSLQYAALKGADIRLSETGYHFVMWDDGEWVNQQMREFLHQK